MFRVSREDTRFADWTSFEGEALPCQGDLYNELGRETPTPVGNEPQNPTSRTALVNPLSALFTENAIGNHRDCAINHRLNEKPIDLEEAGRSYHHAISFSRLLISCHSLMHRSLFDIRIRHVRRPVHDAQFSSQAGAAARP